MKKISPPDGAMFVVENAIFILWSLQMAPPGALQKFLVDLETTCNKIFKICLVDSWMVLDRQFVAQFGRRNCCAIN